MYDIPRSQTQCHRLGKGDLPTGAAFQDAQWMPETVDGTKPHIYYDFPHTNKPFHVRKHLLASLWHIRLPASPLLHRGAITK